MARKAHSALSIQEIVRLICSFTLRQIEVDDCGDPLERGTAFRLILVSRTFFDAAIPFLWENINTKDLFRLVPSFRSFIWGRCVKQDGGFEELDLRDPTAAELSRMQFYGCHVKTMTVGGRPDIGEGPHDDLFQTPLGQLALQYASARSILPNLRRVLVPLHYSRCIPLEWTISLTPASLEYLSIGVDLPDVDHEQRGLRLTKALIEKCSGLETLEIATLDGHPLVFTQLPLSSSLSVLHVRSELVNHDMLDWASKLPSLEQLHFSHGMNDWDALEIHVDPLRHHVFGALTDISVILDAVPDPVTMLWDACEFPLLKKVILCTGRRPFDDPTLHGFAENVVRRNPRIESLMVWSTTIARARVDDDALSDWLNHFRTLKLSELHIHARMSIREDKLRQFIHSTIDCWPDLQRLVWDCQTFTVEQLGLVVSCLPKLGSFKFDSISTPESLVDVTSGSPVLRVPLKLEYNFGHASLLDLDILARCLTKLRCGIVCENTNKKADRTLEYWLNARIKRYAARLDG